jgi:arsenate reductase (glutaredoxin)
MGGVTVYHNPACGTSRNVLGLIRDSGVEPTVIEYLETPPARAELVDLIGRMGMPVRDLLRRKGTPYEELGLDDPTWTDDQLVDLMTAAPDPHQPADRRDTPRREALPPVRKRCSTSCPTRSGPPSPRRMASGSWTNAATGCRECRDD